jgi:hypothetical protein
LSEALESRRSSAPDSTSALQSMLPHVLDTLRREPAVAITLCYLLVAMAGIFYNYWFYRAFDIPVLTLSQISDFLVAGLQQPMALLLVLSTFPLCWLMDLYNLRSRRRHVDALALLRASASLSGYQRLRRRFLEWRVGEMWYTRLSYAAVVAVYGWAFVGIYAKHRAEAVKRGEVAEVRVWLNGENGGLEADRSATWSYLGAVANYVFVYDRTERRALVLPVNAIARLQPMPAPKRPGSLFIAPIP